MVVVLIVMMVTREHDACRVANRLFNALESEGMAVALESSMNTARIVALLTAAGSLLACGGAQRTLVAETVVSSTVSWQHNAETVVDSLVAARCDQEQSCNNIGAGAKFASRQVCSHQFRGNIGSDLSGFTCERGLDSDAVDRCMTAIKSEACTELTRFDKCRTASICVN